MNNASIAELMSRIGWVNICA